MRLIRSALLLAVGVFTSPCLADSWQEPTPEELNMKSEPGGAAAVYLYREEISDDNLHMHSLYVRLKVLSEKAISEADQEISYNGGTFAITDVAGRTIHADGTVVPFTGKPYQKLLGKTGKYTYMATVFTLPAVEVGSILEYRYKLRYDDHLVSEPHWNIQQEYPITQGFYKFVPLSGNKFVIDPHGNGTEDLAYWNNAPPDSKVAYIRDHYELKVKNVAALPNEDLTPPLDVLGYRVYFYYTSYKSVDEFWKGEGKYWNKAIEKFANTSGALRDVVNQTVAPGDSQAVKAKKLYAAVQKLNNTSFGRERTSSEMHVLGIKYAKHAEDIWNQKSGSSDEIALLYMTLLRTAGIPAYALSVVNRDSSVLAPAYLTLNQLDDTLVIATLDGTETYLDPGQSMCPFGQLHWKHAMTGGLRQTVDGNTQLISTTAQNYKSTQLRTIADINLDESGNTTGRIRQILTGATALQWRQLALRTDEEELKQQMTDDLQSTLAGGLEVNINHILNFKDDPAAAMIVFYDVTGNMGTTMQKRLLLPTEVVRARTTNPFGEEAQRKLPIDMHYPYISVDDITIQLPAGMTFDGMPEPQKAEIPHASALLATAKAEGATLTLHREFILAKVTFEPAEYPTLRDFYQKVSTANQLQAVAMTAPGKGNE